MGDSGRGTSVILIGMRGSGKSTVGRVLAGLVGGTHVDTDERVEDRAGKTIADVFEAEGEEGFRRRECEVIAELAIDKPEVVSVGGGAVSDESNRRTLKQLGSVIWLTAPVEVLWSRMQSDDRTGETRPPLTELAGAEELARVLQAREPVYRAIADLTLEQPACQANFICND